MSSYGNVGDVSAPYISNIFYILLIVQNEMYAVPHAYRDPKPGDIINNSGLKPATGTVEHAQNAEATSGATKT